MKFKWFNKLWFVRGPDLIKDLRVSNKVKRKIVKLPLPNVVALDCLSILLGNIFILGKGSDRVITSISNFFILNIHIFRWFNSFSFVSRILQFIKLSFKYFNNYMLHQHQIYIHVYLWIMPSFSSFFFFLFWAFKLSIINTFFKHTILSCMFFSDLQLSIFFS